MVAITGTNEFWIFCGEARVDIDGFVGCVNSVFGRKKEEPVKGLSVHGNSYMVACMLVARAASE